MSVVFAAVWSVLLLAACRSLWVGCWGANHFTGGGILSTIAVRLVRLVRSIVAAQVARHGRRTMDDGRQVTRDALAAPSKPSLRGFGDMPHESTMGVGWLRASGRRASLRLLMK
jgi:hypothetical protein